MYYLQSRYYVPNWCRFINSDIPDIAQQSKDEINGLNLFAYCCNDPVNNSDPTGYAVGVDDVAFWLIIGQLLKEFGEILVVAGITLITATFVIGILYVVSQLFSEIGQSNNSRNQSSKEQKGRKKESKKAGKQNLEKVRKSR